MAVSMYYTWCLDSLGHLRSTPPAWLRFCLQSYGSQNKYCTWILPTPSLPGGSWSLNLRGALQGSFLRETGPVRPLLAYVMLIPYLEARGTYCKEARVNVKDDTAISRGGTCRALCRGLHHCASLRPHQISM